MRRLSAVLAALLIIGSFRAQAADLVVWWEKGYYADEDAALADIIAAFEQKTGKQVEFVFQEIPEMEPKILTALEADRPPDVAFSLRLRHYFVQWAVEGRLVDLTETVGAFSNLFDPETLARGRLRSVDTGEKALYGLPVGRSSNYLHVWKSLLEQAGFALEDIPQEWDAFEDIPQEWDAFWSFWCDQVQPLVRRATGRDDIWGVGLNMSGKAGETSVQFMQFVDAHQADYVSREGKLVIDHPEIRRRLTEATASYTTIYRKGCTPPDAIGWDDRGNNQAFLAQSVVITPNETLSIPNALRPERPEDYFQNVATIEWPRGSDGAAFPIGGAVYFAMAFKGDHVVTAREFVRFLVAEGWLAHYLNFSGERLLPPMPALLNQPFWLDPSDPHRMAGVMQISSRPMEYDYPTVSGDWRYGRIRQEHVWAKAIHRVAVDGISPEQAVDEAIARIKQILSE